MKGIRKGIRKGSFKGSQGGKYEVAKWEGFTGDQHAPVGWSATPRLHVGQCPNEEVKVEVCVLCDVWAGLSVASGSWGHWWEECPLKGDGLHAELRAQSCAVGRLSCVPLALPVLQVRVTSYGVTSACSVAPLRFTFRICSLRMETYAFIWFFQLS